ncbi:putative sola1-9 ap [Aphis craccivora]|uniref:Putative sola1-9 ap n=1 Tax=Aphis craccivora TaxID=307492 RepID=A0A6G0VVK4_APHCR|nr:putative sola1-9 ap [Aphis craccivora]
MNTQEINEYLQNDTDDDIFQDSGSEYLPYGSNRSSSSDEVFSEINDFNNDISQEVKNNKTTQEVDNNEITQDTGSDENTGPINLKTRKRLLNKNNWIKNVRKSKRARSKAYIGSTGKCVLAKTFTPYVCSCLQKCHNLINEAKQQKLHSQYYDLGNYDIQSTFIAGLIKKINKKRVHTKNVDTKKKFTMIYYLLINNGKEESLISDGRISRILAHKNILLLILLIKEAVVDFINRFSFYQSHYSREKSVHRKYLTPDLNINCLYKLYKQQTAEPFNDTFNKKFNLHFHPPVTDSCKNCDNFNIKIKYTVNDEEKQKIETERDLYQRKAENARAGMRIDGLLPKENNTVACIAFDLMKTLPTPVLSTGICYYKRQLWTYCLGIHNLADNTAKMYVWDESVGSRVPQEIGSCILHYIKNFVTANKLIMYSDQCGGQNRNIKMATLCNFIVANDKYCVNEIDHKFLVSGHSFLPCDQDFGLIKKTKKTSSKHICTK